MITETLKVSPIAAVGGLTFFNIPLDVWVQMLAGLYGLLICVDKIYLMFIRYREQRTKLLHQLKGEDAPKE